MELRKCLITADRTNRTIRPDRYPANRAMTHVWPRKSPAAGQVGEYVGPHRRVVARFTRGFVQRTKILRAGEDAVCPAMDAERIPATLGGLPNILRPIVLPLAVLLHELFSHGADKGLLVFWRTFTSSHLRVSKVDVRFPTYFV